jgi:hypothetical protein
MDDQEFLARLKEKIERSTGREIELVLDREEKVRIAIDLKAPVPRVILGFGVLKYPGLARMGVEYAVACIKRGRRVTPLEFVAILQRN